MKKSLLFAAMLATVTATAFAQPAKPAMMPIEAGVVVITATVDSVDMKSRTVMFKDDKGNMVGMRVSKDVNNLGKVKKGDIFVVEHAEAVAVGLTAAGKDAKPGVSGVRSVQIAGKGGAKPFTEITDTVFATVKIASIDAASRVVTFTLPSGEKQKVKVDKAVLGLEKFKVGDDVMVEYADETVITFVTPPAAPAAAPAKK